MTSTREALNSPVTQAAAERIRYIFDFTAWGTPSAPSVKLYNMDDETEVEVSSTKLTGSPEIIGKTVKTPTVISLAAGSRYKLVCAVTIDSDSMSAYCDINTEAL